MAGTDANSVDKSKAEVGFEVTFSNFADDSAREGAKPIGSSTTAATPKG